MFEPITNINSVSKISLIELVAAPLPNACASPATVGAWQVRAQWSILFVLTTAIFVVYSNMKNIKQVTNLISKGTVINSPLAADRLNNIGVSAANGEMASKKWKVLPGNVPVLSSGETGEDKNSKEL